MTLTFAKFLCDRVDETQVHKSWKKRGIRELSHERIKQITMLVVERQEGIGTNSLEEFKFGLKG